MNRIQQNEIIESYSIPPAQIVRELYERQQRETDALRDRVAKLEEPLFLRHTVVVVYGIALAAVASCMCLVHQVHELQRFSSVTRAGVRLVHDLVDSHHPSEALQSPQEYSVPSEELSQ